MSTARLIRLVVLSIVLVGAFGVWYQRGLHWGLGAAPARIESEHQTEEGWIVSEIVRDIVEMSSRAASLNVSSPTLEASAGNRYRVTLAGAGAPIDIDLSQDVWNPGAYATVARNIVGRPRDGRAETAAPVYPRLIELTPAALTAVADEVSRALESNMHSAGAHEAAALTLGAFALREAARWFSDTRWAMNRMTAHLALAQSVRTRDAAGVDGELALAVLNTLAGHHQQAQAAVDRVGRRADDPALQAWSRALRMRISQDWRLVERPESATRLERLEYFRARRATVPPETAVSVLEGLRPDDGTEWLRIMQTYSLSVSDGWAVVSQLAGREALEAAQAFTHLNGRPLPGAEPEVSAALNARAARAVTSDGVRILPWGAWAEAFQRHLAFLVGRVDNFFRHTQDNAGDADFIKLMGDGLLERLAMFPAASVFRTKGENGGEADFSRIDDAITLAVETPERVTPDVWAFVETGVSYEAVRRGMPPRAAWFMRPAKRAALDASVRVVEAGHSLSLQDLESLMEEMPFDFNLVNVYLKRKHGETLPPDEIARLFSARMPYDLRAQRLARDHASDTASRLEAARHACELTIAECIAFASALAQAGRGDDAAVQYRRAFASDAVDSVTIANQSGWLVSYYLTRGRVADAQALAERSAATGAWQGLVTSAYLFERLKRFDEAEALYRRASERYDNPAQLIGFYYRAVNVRRQMEYEQRWKVALAPVFARGLLPVAPPAGGRPERGVIVTRDNPRVRNAGLQAGDIIIGLEGWQVENLRQYYAINAGYESERMILTAWRGKPFEVTISAPNRLMGIEFRSHPIQGWSE